MGKPGLFMFTNFFLVYYILNKFWNIRFYFIAQFSNKNKNSLEGISRSFEEQLRQYFSFEIYFRVLTS